MMRFVASTVCLVVVGLAASCSVVNVPEEPLPSVSSGGGGQSASCGTGAADQACGSECVDVETDEDHCGSCDRPCAADQSCLGGQCECPTGEEDCGDGCVDVESDPDRCGSCDRVCPEVSGSERSCVGGECVGGCAIGFDDCNGLATDGCETELASDPDNCDGCDNACPAVDHGLPGCELGVCGIGSCTAGWDDCDQEPETGCETDLQSTAEHCDGCDNPCGAGQPCIAGVCEYRASCMAIKQNEPTLPSGLYPIDIDGDGPLAPQQAYCDMVTDDGGWTLIVLTNGNVAGHPNATFVDAKTNPANLVGTVSADLDSFDYFVGTSYWNALAPTAQMMWKVGPNAAGVLDIVTATFNVYQDGERIHWSGYAALLGGIPNINYQNDGYLQAMDGSAGGTACIEETAPGYGLHGPWFYQGCSNVSPWCTGHGDCTGLPVRMQWRNQDIYNTATAASCSNHGEIFVR